jgi:hypothetical protein
VVIAAEAITDVQHALTECVQRAHTAALQRADHITTPTDHHPVTHHTTSSAVNTGLAPSRTVLHERSPRTSGERPAGDSGEYLMNAAGERGQPHPVNRPAWDPGRAPQRAGEHRRAPGARVPGRGASCWPTTWPRPARHTHPEW